MNRLTVKDYITIATFLITIATFVYKYGQLNSKVEQHEKQLDKVNVEVLQMRMENNSKTLEKIETKVDKMYEVIMTID